MLTFTLAILLPAGAQTASGPKVGSPSLTIPYNSWALGTPMPTPRDGAFAGVVGTKIYVIGGAFYGNLVSVNEVYDTATDTWSTAASMPTPRWLGATGVVNNIIYTIAGAGTANVVEAYDPSTDTWSEKAPLPVFNDSVYATVANNIIYVVGGCCDSNGRLSSVFAYDPKTDAWTSLASLGVGKSQSALGAFGSVIVSAGGLLNSGFATTDNEGYDVTKNTWTELAPLLSPRHAGCFETYGNTLYFAGGHSIGNGDPVATMDAYDAASNLWTPGLPEMPYGLVNLASASLNGRLYCFGGNDAGDPGAGNSYNFVQIYQPASDSTAITLTASPSSVTYGQPLSVSAKLSGSPAPTGTLTYTLDGGAAQTATLSSGSATLNLGILAAGSHALAVTYTGDSTYGSASQLLSFTVSRALLSATAASFSRPFGTANPMLTYALSGFVNGDTSAVVSGSATLTTTATTTSPAGKYPITFATEALTAANYTFTYVPGILTVTGSGPSECEIIDYSKGFTTTGLSLNGGATVTNKSLQLTDGGFYEARSAFYSTALPVTNFTTDFTFQLLYALADGITFTIQSNNPQEVGQAGGGLGYAGIPHSVAIKADLFDNNGEGFDSTGAYLNGAYPSTPAINLFPAGINLHSGHIFAVHIAYANDVTTAKITDTVTSQSASITVPGDLSKVVGDTAYVGFTGGTGALIAIQNILTWSYSGGSGCSAK
jgi:N-acetylneuraminic acid mutarotase